MLLLTCAMMPFAALAVPLYTMWATDDNFLNIARHRPADLIKLAYLTAKLKANHVR